jgi:nicotinate-nucleotide--dimethylbenzimidazole phosphoribosyltransferase
MSIDTGVAPDALGPLEQAINGIGYPDSEAGYACQQLLDSTAATGSLGRLNELAVWTSSIQGQFPPRDFARARAVIFAGDHGVATADAIPVGVPSTAERVALLVAGGGALPVLADLAGASVRLADLSVDADTDASVADFKVRRSSGSIDSEDAMSVDDTRAAVEAGITLADAEIDAGADLLVVGALGLGNTIAAGTLISIQTDTEPIRVVGWGPGMDDSRWVRHCTAVRDARRRARPHRNDLLQLLATAGGADIAAMTGFLLQAANRRTPVLLDGVAVVSAALLAQSVNARIVRWLRAGHLSAEPAHTIALDRLGLEPIIDLQITADEAAGALLAVPLLRAAVRSVSVRATPPAEVV